jgi:hypothetical protein
MPIVKPPRPKPHSLSAAERRVLDAFSCGRLPAGKLSAALAVARRRTSESSQPTTGSYRLAA